MKKKKTIIITESTLKKIIKEAFNSRYNPRFYKTRREIEEEESEYSERSKVWFYFDPETKQIAAEGREDKENDELIGFIVKPVLQEYKDGFRIADIRWYFELTYPYIEQFSEVIDTLVYDNREEIEKIIADEAPCGIYLQ